MKNIIIILALVFNLSFPFISAQEPLSYFPHSVGNRWDYDYWNGNTNYYTTTITRDSLSQDGSKFLFYDNDNEPRYKVDTSYNVFRRPYIHGDNYLIYKLYADSGDAWFNPALAEWAWVARIDTGYVFSNLTTIKVYQYGPAHPDSTPFPYILRERWLASGFGLIYEWEEPGYFYSLKGCIVEGDTFGIITSVEANIKLPIKYSLIQNYPNPFNPQTTIKFYLPERTFVILKVFDLLGDEVKSLVNEEKDIGYHEITFDGSGLPSGVYFYTLQTSEFFQTKKMVLLR